MTDWLVGGGAMNRKDNKYAPSAPGHVAAAGGNLYMPGCRQDFDDMKKALAEGTVTRKQLQINASRTLRILKSLASNGSLT